MSPRPSGEDELEGTAEPEAEASISISLEDVVEGEMGRVFEAPRLRCFLGFVGAGLPDAYLRAHPELSKTESLQEIRRAIDQVADQALREHLASRCNAIETLNKHDDAPAPGPAPKAPDRPRVPVGLHGTGSRKR